MNIFTHLMISTRIMGEIEKYQPLNLSRLHFLYGSIKPDISPSMKHLKHYKHRSQDYVASELEMLYTQDCSNAEFSMRLGIVSHFISDYFCFAHSRHFKGGIIKHLFYEHRLWKHFISGRQANEGCLEALIPGLEMRRGLNSFWSGIERLHCRYLSQNSKNSAAGNLNAIFIADSSFTLEAIFILLMFAAAPPLHVSVAA